MADIRTTKITRDKLAKVFGNQEIIKLIENLVQDVSVGLPSEIVDNTSAIAAAAYLARAAQAAADEAQSAADAAAASALEVRTLLMTARTQASEIATLRRELAEARAITIGTRTWL